MNNFSFELSLFFIGHEVLNLNYCYFSVLFGRWYFFLIWLNICLSLKKDVIYSGNMDVSWGNFQVFEILCLLMCTERKILEELKLYLRYMQDGIKI